MTVRRRILEKMPYCELPITFHRDESEDTIKLSDGNTYRTGDLRLEATYKFEENNLNSAALNRNIGLGMRRRLERLGHPLAGITEIRRLEGGESGTQVRSSSKLRLYVSEK